MVKNKIGGNKSKNISSKVTKKKIRAEDPDFENSFFAKVMQKPNGLICLVKIIVTNSNVKNILEANDMEGNVQVNIGKLKHDKRNNTIMTGDIVQVEFTFDMNRQNGNKYGAILCKYDNDDLKEFKRAGILKMDDIEDEPEELMDSEHLDTTVEEKEISLDDL
jgi:hypothetical protein